MLASGANRELMERGREKRMEEEVWVVCVSGWGEGEDNCGFHYCVNSRGLSSDLSRQCCQVRENNTRTQIVGVNATQVTAAT